MLDTLLETARNRNLTIKKMLEAEEGRRISGRKLSKIHENEIMGGAEVSNVTSVVDMDTLPRTAEMKMMTDATDV